MLNILTELGTGNWKLDFSKAFCSKPSRRTRVKILGIKKEYEDETVNIF